MQRCVSCLVSLRAIPLGIALHPRRSLVTSRQDSKIETKKEFRARGDSDFGLEVESKPDTAPADEDLPEWMLADESDPLDLQTMDIFKPIAPPNHGVGSEKRRAKAKKDLFLLAQKRLDHHYRRGELIELVTKAELNAEPNTLHKHELIDLIVVNRWRMSYPGFEPVNPTRGPVAATDAPQGKRISVAKLPLTPNLVESIAKRAQGSCVVYSVQLPSKARLGEHEPSPGVPLRQVIETRAPSYWLEECDRHVLLALHQDQCEAVAPLYTETITSHSDRLFSAFPHAHRFAQPRSWGEAAVWSRIREPRTENADTQEIGVQEADAAREPLGIASDIAGYLSSESVKRDADIRPPGSSLSSTSTLSNQARALTAMLAASPGFAERSRAAWQLQLDAGYICHRMSTSAGDRFVNIQQRTLQELLGSSICNRFRYDLPSSVVASAHVSSRSERRRVIYRLVRLGSEAGRHPVLPRLAPKTTLLIYEERAHGWEAKLEDAVAAKVILPDLSMDVQLSATRAIQMPLGERRLTPILAELETGQPALPGLEALLEVVAPEIGFWSLEADLRIRESVISTQEDHDLGLRVIVEQGHGASGERIDRFRMYAGTSLDAVSIRQALDRYKQHIRLVDEN